MQGDLFLKQLYVLYNREEVWEEARLEIIYRNLTILQHTLGVVHCHDLFLFLGNGSSFLDNFMHFPISSSYELPTQKNSSWKLPSTDIS